MHQKVFFLIVLVALAGGGCQAQSQDQRDGVDLRPVEVEAVGQTDIVQVLKYPADLKPYLEVKVFSPVFDRILWFPFKEGDFVTRGQRLALIRKEGLEKGLERMLAEEEALEVQIANLRDELERSRELLKSGVITQPAFDKLKSTYDATLARKKALEAGRGQLQLQASDAEVRSPISGVLAGKMFEAGDMATLQLPLCRLMDIERLRMEIRLVEQDAVRVKPGMTVNLKLDCCPDRVFPAQVNRVWPYLDPASRTNTIEVVLENPRDEKGSFLLKPGMFGTAEIVLGVSRGATVAPEYALVLDNEVLGQQKAGEMLRLAFVVEKDRAVRRLVRIGQRNGQMMEVLEGLRPGERVIVRGQHGLRDGQPVKVVNSPRS
jgi:membrane fusion protein (multidrug efflux system)